MGLSQQGLFVVLPVSLAMLTACSWLLAAVATTAQAGNDGGESVSQSTACSTPAPSAPTHDLTRGRVYSSELTAPPSATLTAAVVSLRMRRRLQTTDNVAIDRWRHLYIYMASLDEER